MDKITERELYETLGVKPPETDGPEDGIQTGTVAAETLTPAGDFQTAPEDGQPAVEPEAAGPGRGEGGTGDAGTAAGREDDAGGEGGEDPAADTTTGKAPLSREERARSDAARRRAEMDAAIRQAVQQATAEQAARHQQQMAMFFATANLKDPATGRAITSMEEYNTFMQGQQLRRIEENLRKGKLPMEDLQALIASQVAANRDAAADRRAAPPAGQAREVTQAQVDRELAEIGRLDPGVKTLEDVLALETGPAFAEAVKRGASFIEAFKLANFDRLQQAREAETARRAQQAALNSQRSKEHLAVSAQKGQGGVAVPAEEMALYRKLNPEATEAEIQAHYSKTMKMMKR